MIKFLTQNKFYSKLLRKIRKIRLKLSGSNTFFYKTPLNFKFICIPEQATSRGLYLNLQQKEQLELEIAINWIQQGDICLDLGANIGYWSVTLANCVGREGKILSVEASPKTVKYLEQGIKALNLNQVHIEQACITNKNGLTEFMIAKENGSEVKQSLQVSEKQLSYYQKQMVKTMTLNSLLEKREFLGEVSFIKIDIEGAEPLALQEGNHLLDVNALPLFIIEIYKVGLKRLNFTPSSILQYFPIELFELYQINRSYPNPSTKFDYGVIYPVINPKTDDWLPLTNLIAIPKKGKFSQRKKKLINVINKSL